MLYNNNNTCIKGTAQINLKMLEVLDLSTPSFCSQNHNMLLKSINIYNKYY